MDRRPEIDGLRAVAVVPVVLFHAGMPGLGGGFLGVDVFFVISGFLITGLIAEDLLRGRFSLIGFYERRARRILPALFVVLLCCLPFAWAWMLPWQFKDFSQSLVAVIAFASNFLFAFKQGYFEASVVDQKVLIHTWSLGVEEQFYLLYPLLLVVLWRLGRRWPMAVLTVLALGSLALAEWGSRSWPIFNFYFSAARAWELIAGAICALALAGRAVKGSEALAVAGLAAILGAMLFGGADTPSPSVFTVVPVLGTCAVLTCATGRTAVGRMLASTPFVGIGLVSYSAYLWHQPLFAFARIVLPEEPPMALMLSLSVAAFALAYLTWRFVETPCRHGGRVRPVATRPFVAGISAAAAVIVAAGLHGHFSGGRESIWKRNVAPSIATMYDLIKAAKGPGADLPRDDGRCVFNVPKLDPVSERRIVDCARMHGPGLAVLGDSHAIDLYGALGPAVGATFVVGISQGYCRPNKPLPYCQYAGFKEFLAAHGGVFARVAYTQTGRSFLIENGREAGAEYLRGLPIGNPVQPLPIDTASAMAVLSYLNELTAYARVQWFGPRIEIHVPERFLLRQGCDHAYALRPGQEDLFRSVDREIAGIVARAGAGVEYISMIDRLRFDARTDITDCTHLYWSDGDHWSADGERRFGARLKAGGI